MPSTPPPKGGSILRPKYDAAPKLDTSPEAVAKRREERLARNAAQAVARMRTSTWQPHDLKIPHRDMFAGPDTEQVYERLTEARSLGRRAFGLRLEASQGEQKVKDARSTDAMTDASAVRAGKDLGSPDAANTATQAHRDLQRQYEATEAAALQAYGEFRALLREHKHTLKTSLDRQNRQEWAEVLQLIDKITAMALTRQNRRLFANVWCDNPYSLPTGPDQNIVGALRQARAIWTSLPQTEDGIPKNRQQKLGGPDAVYPTGDEQRQHVMAGAAHATPGKDPDGPGLVRTSQGTLATGTAIGS